MEIVNSTYTGKILGAVPYGKNKVEEVKNLLEKGDFILDQSYAFADHFSDSDLLELVTNPIVVNPDRRLRKIAKRRGWNVYKFK